MPNDYSFTRYLAAKKSVDDRALNRHVWGSLVRALPAPAPALPAAAPAAPLQVLEIGAGIGTMLQRLLDWGALTHAAYTGIDARPANIAEALRRLPAWASGQGFGLEQSPGHMWLQREAGDVSVEFETIDLFDFVARERGQRTWDLLIAHAFLDLMDVPATLPSLACLVRPGGLLYLTIVFDGATIFQPEIEPALDTQIEILYHQTMDQRFTAGKPSGDSRAGRHLFDHLPAASLELLDAGSSDWVVFPGPDRYPADEAYFLHFILHTLHTALDGHPHLDPARFAAWIAQRHAQVESASLVYIAHQLDFLALLKNPGF